MKRYLKYILILLLFFPSIIKAETISYEDAKKIAKHIIDKNILTDDAYIVAADYNNDTSIKMNDVMKLLKDNS